MLEYRKVAGSTDVSVVIRIIDSTDGTPETAVEHNTSGIDLEYRREGAASTDITEAALTALTDAHSDGGIEHIGNGYYRLDLPDAACASGVTGCLVHGTVTGMIVIGCYIHLEPVPADLRQIAGAAVSTSTAQLGVNVVNFGGSAGTFASGIPQASLTTSAINSVADQVWDEATSGHVSSGSFGQAWNTIRAGTAQAGANTTITLDASASAVDDFYNNARIFITAGTGAGQGRFISDYVGATKVATVATWATNPSSDSVFVIVPFGSIPGASAPTAGEVADAVWDEARSGHVSSGSFGELAALALRANTAQAGTASTITLDASASATNNLYQYCQISIIGGTGAGQSRQISAYVGASKVATVGVNWAVNPSSDSVFVITPFGVDAATVSAIADAVWDEARSGHVAAGSFGEYTNADIVRISGDANSADNLEAYTDGSTPMPVNMTQVSGDSTAADNLEAALDGTGGVTITAALTGDVTGNLSGSVGSVTGAVGSVTATANANVVQVSGDSGAADNLEALLDGTGGVTLVASAITLTTPVTANVTQISGDATAADNLESYTDGNGFMPVNVQQIDGTEVTGDGSGTPWGPA
jgi:hypothetical protein